MPKYLVTTAIQGNGGTKFSELAAWAYGGDTSLGVPISNVNQAKYSGPQNAPGTGVDWFSLSLYGSQIIPGQYFYRIQLLSDTSGGYFGTVSITYPYTVNLTYDITPYWFPSETFSYFTITAQAEPGYAFKYWAIETPDGTNYSFTPQQDIYYNNSTLINGSVTKMYAIFTPEISNLAAQCAQNFSLANLDVTTYRNGTPITQITDNTTWSQATTGAWCYYNNSVSFKDYGKLYNQYAIMDPRGIVPLGTYIPFQEAADYPTLISCLGGSIVAGGKMKETGLVHWNSPNTGASNSTYFGARGGGIRDAWGVFSGTKTVGAYWATDSYFDTYWPNIANGNYTELRLTSSSAAVTLTEKIQQDPSCIAGAVNLHKNSYIIYDGANNFIIDGQAYCASGNVDTIYIYQAGGTAGGPTGPYNPCISGTTGSASTSRLVQVTYPTSGNYVHFRVTGSLSGVFATGPTAKFLRWPPHSSEGRSVRYVIPTATIGNQIWTKYNLDVSQYRNGDVIPQATTAAAWAAATTGTWCWYGFNYSAYGSIYGKLYNTLAVNDPRGLAPEGWHIPTQTEYNTLFSFLGGNSVAGGKMKTGPYWTSPNQTLPTQVQDFFATPGGAVDASGNFSGVNNSAFFHAAKSTPTGFAYFVQLDYNSTSAFAQPGVADKIGYSVRCVRNLSGNAPVSFSINPSSCPMSAYIKIQSVNSGAVAYDEFIQSGVSYSFSRNIPPDDYMVYVYHYSSSEGGLQSAFCDNQTGNPLPGSYNNNITGDFSYMVTIVSGYTYTFSVYMKSYAGACISIAPPTSPIAWPNCLVI